MKSILSIGLCLFVWFQIRGGKQIMKRQSMKFPSHIMINPIDNQLQFRVMDCFANQAMFIRVPIESAKFTCQRANAPNPSFLLTPNPDGISYDNPTGFSSVQIDMPENDVGISETLYIINGSNAIPEVFDYFSKMLRVNGDPLLLINRSITLNKNDENFEQESLKNVIREATQHEMDSVGDQSKPHVSDEDDPRSLGEKLQDQHYFDMKERDIHDYIRSDEFKDIERRRHQDREKETKERIHEKLFKDKPKES